MGDGFEVETLINIRVAQAGLIVREVASYEYSRIHGVSNLNAFSGDLRVLHSILAERYRFRDRREPKISPLTVIPRPGLKLADTSSRPVEQLRSICMGMVRLTVGFRFLATSEGAVPGGRCVFT